MSLSHREPTSRAARHNVKSNGPLNAAKTSVPTVPLRTCVRAHIHTRTHRGNARNMDTYVTGKRGQLVLWCLWHVRSSILGPQKHGNVLPNTLIARGTGGLINQRCWDPKYISIYIYLYVPSRFNSDCTQLGLIARLICSSVFNMPETERPLRPFK